MTESIVLIHGLWMKGQEMFLLQRRLQRAGFRVYRFSYRSVAGELGENAARLNTFLHSVEGATVHFVAHSLGGLVVRRLFHDYPDQRPGRIVTLGTPHKGSYVADRLGRSSLFRRLLGRSMPPLTGDLQPWSGIRELGSIAGTLPFGVGWLVWDMPRPNDGTVAVAETRAPNITDHTLVHASHMGMLLSKQAARQTINFLRHGCFEELR